MRYCETDAAEHVELLIAEHVGERDLRAAEEVAAAGDAEIHRRPAVEEHLLELALLLLVLGHQRVRHRRLEVDDRPGRAEVGGRGLGQRFLALERVQPVLALVIGDEGDARLRRAVAQHHRRVVAGERIGELLQLAVLQVERPDVVDGAVLRDVGIDRLGRIGGGRGEHQRVGVEELRAAFVVRAEGQLRALAGREIQAGTAFRCR